MKNEIQIIDDNHSIKEFGWTKSQFETIQRTYFQNMDFDQIKIFGHVCKHTGLDPFLKQIYPVLRQGKMCIQTAIDGYRLIAERTGKYSPGREPTYVYKNDGSILSSTSYVKKMTDDGTWHEVAATAYFDEYCPNVGPFWKKMPHVMISKCAEALALRKAFPAELSGVRTEDEMDQAILQDSNNPLNTPTNTTLKPEIATAKDNITTQRISPEQVSEIKSLLAICSDEYRKNLYDNFKTHLNVDEIDQLKASHYNSIISKIKLHLENMEQTNV